MSRDQILLTSSDNIPHSKIEHQFGVVDSQIVIGANIFRDVFSSFRDIFGGETKGYKKDLDKMKRAAFSEIKAKAKDHGANAIIGLRLDLDEISGGGKSMFMLNAYGSAVKLEKSILATEQEKNTIDEISFEDIQYHKERNAVKKQIQSADEIIKEVSLNKISNYDLWDRNNALSVLNYENTASRSLENNFSDIPIEFIEEYLKENIHTPQLYYWNTIFKNLDQRDWFNHELIYELLQDENFIKRFRALRLCILKKNSYKREEIKSFEVLGHFLNSHFDTSVESREVSKMIGNKKVFKCPYCLKDTPLEKDRNCDCHRTKYGFKKASITPKSIANNLLETAEALKSAFSQYD